MSASESVSRGGQPSTTTPPPPPGDSPQVVMRKSCPNEFPIQPVCGKNRRWSNRFSCLARLLFGEIPALLEIKRSDFRWDCPVSGRGGANPTWQQGGKALQQSCYFSL